ncbi:cytochrome P450 monooxygenase [Corynascus similis CBS 632.67]
MAVSSIVELSLGFDLGGWLLVLGAAAAISYVISAFRTWWRLREFKGPFLASFSYLWLIRAVSSGRMFEWWLETEARYGAETPSTVRVGPNELLTSDPDVIRRTSGARSRYSRSGWYQLANVDPYEDAMISTRDTAKHDKLKAQTAPGYTGKEHPGLEGDLDLILGQLTDKIRTAYATAGPGEEKPMLDLASLAQSFTLDSISKIAFGEEFGVIQKKRDIQGYLEALETAVRGIVIPGVVPYIRAILMSKLVLSFIGPTSEDKKGVGLLMGIGKPIVAKRFAQANAKDQEDMLSSFIRHGLTQRECELESIIQIIAGSDTTATTIRTIMLYLMSTPRAYRALQAEIDEAIRAGRVSSPITQAEALALPYLQAVIYEGLRIAPPFTAVPFKVVPPEGDTIDGKRVPGGTLVAPNFWTTGRNRGIFGTDVDVFRPERWLEPQRSIAERAEMRRVAELAFGYGRWGCAGKMIAFLELNKVFVELLRRFDFQLVYPTRPWKSVNYNLFLQREMWVTVTAREEAELQKKG